MSSHGAECHAPQAAAANTSSLDQAGQGLFMIKFVKDLQVVSFFDQKPSHTSTVGLLNPLKRTFRLFKDEISSFFFWGGGRYNFGLQGSGCADPKNMNFL